MATKLRLAYASPHESRLPREVTETLPPKNWFLSTHTFEEMNTLEALPDFTWLDFGANLKVGQTKKYLQQIAELWDTRKQPNFVFISGHAASREARRILAEYIFSTLPRPGQVEVDFAGNPDFQAAIAKFVALRRAAKPTSLPAHATTQSDPILALRAPNADLRTDRGNLSIKLVADLFGLNVAELGRLIGKDKRATLAKTPDADALQEGLRPFGDIASLRLVNPGDDQFRMWLRAPHENMQGRSPLEWIQEGRVRDVAGFVHGALTGQST